MKLKIIILLFFSLALSVSTFADEDAIRIMLPVRSIEKDPMAQKLKKEDLNLFVNSERRDIVDLIERSKSIGRVSDLGKNFILSFQMTEYSSQVKQGIDYFITEILTPRDSLVIVTPISAYRIKVSSDKEQLIMDVEELAKKDSLSHKKNKGTAERNLENELNKMTVFLSDLSEDSYGVNIYKAVARFLSSYSQKLLDFNENFLIPQPSKFLRIIQLSDQREGERWWIHFQPREESVIISKSRGIIPRINSYLTLLGNYNPGQARGMRKSLSHLEKLLFLADSFPGTELLNTFLKADMSYCVIHWGALNVSETNNFQESGSNLTEILTEICKKSGGTLVNSADLEQGFIKLKDHTDLYYQLVFDFNQKAENKKLQILDKENETNLIYRDEILKEELEALIRQLADEKIEIVDYSFHNNLLDFSIKSFRLEKDYGLIRVKIDLLDNQNKSVYQNENTLRATMKTIHVSIPMPSRLRGKYRLVITAIDLIANSLDSVDHDIVLR